MNKRGVLRSDGLLSGNWAALSFAWLGRVRQAGRIAEAKSCRKHANFGRSQGSYAISGQS